MTEESKIEVPNFEATSDGKKIFTPKQWLGRFRQYAKRKHKMDITELIRGAEMTQTGWAGKEAEIQEDFIWGIGTEALYQMTRAEFKTEPDRIAVKDLIRLFNEYFLPKRNTYHNRGEFFWTKYRIRNTGGFLAETDRDRERMCIRRNNSRRSTHFKIYDRNYGYETPR